MLPPRLTEKERGRSCANIIRVYIWYLESFCKGSRILGIRPANRTYTQITSHKPETPRKCKHRKACDASCSLARISFSPPLRRMGSITFTPRALIIMIVMGRCYLISEPVNITFDFRVHTATLTMSPRIIIPTSTTPTVTTIGQYSFHNISIIHFLLLSDRYTHSTAEHHDTRKYYERGPYQSLLTNRYLHVNPSSREKIDSPGSLGQPDEPRAYTSMSALLHVILGPDLERLWLGGGVSNRYSAILDCNSDNSRKHRAYHIDRELGLTSLSMSVLPPRSR